jgi:hypothetical protein
MVRLGEFSNTTKTGGREVAMSGHAIKSIRIYLQNSIKIKNEQIKLFSQRIESGGIKDKKVILLQQGCR